MTANGSAFIKELEVIVVSIKRIIRKIVQETIIDLPMKYRIMNINRSERKNIRQKKHLYEKVHLSGDEKENIDSFYTVAYGSKVPYKWHRLYQSYTGIYDRTYLPEIIYSTKLADKMNPYNYADVLQDKNLLNVLFSDVEGVRLPQIYVICANGTFLDSERNLINIEQAISILSNAGSVAVKKSVESSSGRDVMICNFVNGIDLKSGEKVSDIINNMKIGGNFKVEEKINQYHELEYIYSKSLNTFRVITYILDNRIFCAPLSMRIGRSGSEVDNIHHGGIVIGVSQDGELMGEAYSEFQERFTKHPDSNVVFKGYRISKVSEIIEAAKRLHVRVPFMKMLSWDLSIDSDGKVVLIELNATGQSIWFPQMVNGKSLFGENTKEVLQKYIYKR